jgi:hypothetical protein
VAETVNRHVLVVVSFEIITSGFSDDAEYQLAVICLLQNLVNNLGHGFRAHVFGGLVAWNYRAHLSCLRLTPPWNRFSEMLDSAIPVRAYKTGSIGWRYRDTTCEA